MRILYGTTNQVKLDAMKRITEVLGIEIIGLKDVNQPLPRIEESGKNPLENAKMKAEAYYKAFSMPVFSCDSGLYFYNIEEALQPGTHIRRVNGKELTDEEMIEYYSGLAKSHDDRLIGRYRNAIYFILDDETKFFSMDKSLETEPFMLVSKPHEKRIKGFPLDSISVDLASEKYYYDIEEKSVDQSAVLQGFKAFFERCFQSLQKVHND